MSNQEWWAAERKAVEFWRQVREHQTARYNRSGMSQERGAAPSVRNERFGDLTHRQLPGI